MQILKGIYTHEKNSLLSLGYIFSFLFLGLKDYFLLHTSETKKKSVFCM